MRALVWRISAAFLLFFALQVASGGPAMAQETPSDPGKVNLHLSAVLGDTGVPLQAGLHWRLFNARADADGSHALIAESLAAQPGLVVEPGDYVVHVAFGLASATKRISVTGEQQNERVTLKAGALKITATRGGEPIDANRLSIAIYVPERNNPEARLVYSKARAGDILGVPEGSYHIVSTYLDSASAGALPSGKALPGAPNNAVATNSIVAADIKVPSGKLLDVTLRHRYATLTLKLVNAPGAEALANTSFTVLTPGGDLIRELIGAFPSLVLAEGEYIVIARHDAKTYQSTFQVQSALDHDVEVIAQ
jgi:hypothetical protein